MVTRDRGGAHALAVARALPGRCRLPIAGRRSLALDGERRPGLSNGDLRMHALAACRNWCRNG